MVAHANKCAVTSVPTFDQPLYWKTVTIQSNEEDGCGI